MPDYHAEMGSSRDVAVAPSAHPPGTLEHLLDRLRAADPSKEGANYELTYNNTLPKGALLAMPPIWGMRASEVPENHSRELVNELQGIVASAEYSVDILSLGLKFAGGKFRPPDTGPSRGERFLARDGQADTQATSGVVNYLRVQFMT